MATTKKSNLEKQADYHKQVAQEIIDMLEKGTAPWQKPWTATMSMIPHNGSSKRRYHGMNALRLMYISLEKKYNDNRWMTFKQIQELGGKVRKGEKGTLVTYWKFTKKEKDEDGNEVEKELDHPVPFRSIVFNAAQCDGLPEQELKLPEQKWTAVERAENIINAAGVPIYHDQADRNFYSPMLDEIHLTPKGSFADNEAYYSTALHELGHSTSHESRLNRDIKNTFGNEDYAKEELRAEIASYMLCAELGIANAAANEQHAAYVGSWIKALKKDPAEIFRAAKDADAICEYLYEREREFLKVKQAEASSEKDAVILDIDGDKVSADKFNAVSKDEPMVYIKWSECSHPKLASGSIMTLHEADKLLQQLDEKIRSERENPAYGRYYKTKLFIMARDENNTLLFVGTNGEDRYDLGDREGGLISPKHLSGQYFKMHEGLSRLQECIENIPKGIVPNVETALDKLPEAISKARAELNSPQGLSEFFGQSADTLLAINQSDNFSKVLPGLIKAMSTKTVNASDKPKKKLILSAITPLINSNQLIR